MSKPVVLVTGQNGQLGNELKVIAGNYTEFDFHFTDVAEMDITDGKMVRSVFEEYKPVICINTAAYTAVDKAETERDLAMKINATAVGILAENCKRSSTRFIQVSTDYVFDGNGTSPYTEDHAVCPVNFYGESKLQGEQIALQTFPSTVIVRTSWVYSYYGANFVKTMLRLMRERESISVINDQFGSPTYAADLAEALMKIASAAIIHPGVYHFSNAGEISWFDFAVAIRDIAGLSCNVLPVDTAGYPTPAKRPGYSVMNKEKIQSTYEIKLKDWEESLRECLSLLLP